jgi:hypothetical protein
MYQSLIMRIAGKEYFGTDDIVKWLLSIDIVVWR